MANGGQRTRERRVLLTRLEQVRLQHGLGEFFHEQRHAIGLRHDLLQHCGRQGLAARHPRHHLSALLAGKAVQGEVGELGPGRPRRVKLGAKGQHEEEPGRWHLVDAEPEQLQRRGVGPVQVFPHHQDRLALRLLQQPGRKRVQGALLLALGRERQRRRVCRRGQGEQCRQQRHGVRLGETIRRQHALQLRQLLLGGVVPLPL